MTIAQHKIRQYSKDNNISLHKLSLKLGYSTSYLGGIVLGYRIPAKREKETINGYFNIIDESKKISAALENKYRFASIAHGMYNLNTGLNVGYYSMLNWYRGRYPKNMERAKGLCKMLDLRNEWVEEFDNRYDL